jgi:hypothetical protein
MRKKDMEFAKIQQSLLKHMGASRQQKSDKHQPSISIINGGSGTLIRDEKVCDGKLLRSFYS